MSTLAFSKLLPLKKLAIRSSALYILVYNYIHTHDHIQINTHVDKYIFTIGQLCRRRCKGGGREEDRVPDGKMCSEEIWRGVDWASRMLLRRPGTETIGEGSCRPHATTTPRAAKWSEVKWRLITIQKTSSVFSPFFTSVCKTPIGSVFQSTK